MAEIQNRDANQLRWKESTGLDFLFQGLNIGKLSTGKHYDGVAVVKNVKTVMSEKGGTLPLNVKVVELTVRHALRHQIVNSLKWSDDA